MNNPGWTFRRFFYNTFGPKVGYATYWATHPSIWKSGGPILDTSQYGNEPPKQQQPQFTPMDIGSSAYSGYMTTNNFNPTPNPQQRINQLTFERQFQQPQQPDAFEAPKPATFENTGGPQNTDYAQTATAKRYAAQGTKFSEQLRWDPTTKKYQKIGALIKQGKLNPKG